VYLAGSDKTMFLDSWTSPLLLGSAHQAHTAHHGS